MEVGVEVGEVGHGCGGVVVGGLLVWHGMGLLREDRVT